MSHFNWRTLQRFVQGGLDADGSRDVVMHLLRGCDRCHNVAAELWRSLERSGSSPGAVLAPQLVKAGGWTERPGVTAEAQPCEAPRCPVEWPGPGAARARDFGKTVLCDLLMEQSWKSRFAKARRSLDFAYLGVTVAETLEREKYGGPLVNDLRARAWAGLSYAQAMAWDRQAAAASLSNAQGYFWQGTGAPGLRARLLNVKAVLRLAQEQYDEAANLFKLLMTIYEAADDAHSLGSAMVDRGAACGHLEQYEAAISWTLRGIDLLEPDADPSRYVDARRSLAHWLFENCQWNDARSVLQETYPLCLALDDRLTLARLRWIEARISLGNGFAAEAESCLVEAWEEFRTQGLGFEVAWISLELAAMYARQGRTERVRELAIQTVPIVGTTDLYRNPTTAKFPTAPEDRAASLALCEELLAYFKKVQDNPQLRFEPPP